MNPTLIREKDVSHLLTWKYSLSNKRPLVVHVYFVALKTANGQHRQSKADDKNKMKISACPEATSYPDIYMCRSIMHRQPQNQRVYTSTFCAWRSHACCSCPLSISQDTRVLFTAHRWNNGRADKLTEHVSFKRMAISMPEDSAVLLPHKNCVKSDIYRRRWRGL